jgi:hypothetical protein
MWIQCRYGSRPRVPPKENGSYNQYFRVRRLAFDLEKNRLDSSISAKFIPPDPDQYFLCGSGSETPERIVCRTVTGAIKLYYIHCTVEKESILSRRDYM